MTFFEPAPFTIVREGATPEPPETLDNRGATLWREVLISRRITSRVELIVLEHACQCHSRAESLRQQIVAHGELIITEHGAVKANPLLMVEVQCRALCSRLLSKLRAPEEKPRMGRPPKSF
jgi:phage terminase small subunit